MSNHKRIRRMQLTRHAEGYLELGLPALALETLDRLDAGWVDSHVFYLRGEALRSLERYAEAIVALGDAAELAPDDYHIWLALGWCYKRLGKLRLAIHTLETALEIEPGEAIIYYNLACYWALAENKDNALDYLAQAFEIDPNYRDLVHAETDFDALRGDADFQALASVIV